MNIEIAKACGWNFTDRNKGSRQFAHIVVISKDGKDVGGFYPEDSKKLANELHRAGVPNYCGDLNAIHEAERAEALLRTLKLWKET